ncbi:MAG: aldehyde dehydrogenase family protein [Alphaproteobacteria bacterium]|nr:MAG: aldehyde dehydrogenase family protein [Alphaproteobacteria bacterium]
MGRDSVSGIFESMDWGPAPESAAEAIAWLERHDRRFGHFIGGRWVEPAERFATRNPATGEVLAEVGQAGPEEVARAVRAARRAQPRWAALGGHGRARVLYALARLVQKHSRLLAVLETLDNGKPIRESRDIDIPLVARHFYWHAGAAQLLERSHPGRAPWGVCGQIIPWNFPLLMLAWKVAPALATGNTVVLKPAEQTPLTALLFAGICREAGVPPGVVNIVTGDGRTGEALVAAEVDKIAFTGSTEVGRRIRERTAGSGKGLTLELGGKSPYIVFDDADLDSAVEGLVDAIWFNQGQVCCAGSRLLVQESIAGEFERRLLARMAKLRVGDPLDKAIDVGAIVDEAQLERIRALVATAGPEGGTVHQPVQDLPARGCFYPPTLVTGLGPAATLMQEEVFGPVLAMTTFRTPAEAVQLANNTRYGLAATLWSENINLALDVAPKLVAGVVWINGTNFFDAAAGFGGRRESGFGREGGTEGLEAYLRPALPPALPRRRAAAARRRMGPAEPAEPGGIDRTAKMYIGGRQTRPDGGHVRPVLDARGRLAGHVGAGNRKDVRNAVEAARKAQGPWAAASAHLRAQILYYLAENLSARAPEFAARIAALTGATAEAAGAEVEAAVARLFEAAAWADRWEGRVHNVPLRGTVLAMREPQGVIGVLCPDEAPLLGLVSVIGPAVATGNAVVAVPSQDAPLVATDFYQLLDTSDVPGGVVNIVTGFHAELGPVLAAHHDVDALWHFGDAALTGELELAAAPTLKRSFVGPGPRDWQAPEAGGPALLEAATDVKNVWIPWGA